MYALRMSMTVIHIIWLWMLKLNRILTLSMTVNHTIISNASNEEIGQQAKDGSYYKQ